MLNPHSGWFNLHFCCQKPTSSRPHVLTERCRGCGRRGTCGSWDPHLKAGATSAHHSAVWDHRDPSAIVTWLVVFLEHDWMIFPLEIINWQLSELIFFRWVETTNQWLALGHLTSGGSKTNCVFFFLSCAWRKSQITQCFSSVDISGFQLQCI